MSTIVFSVLAALAVGASFAWLAERNRSQPKLAVLEKSNRTLLEHWTEARDELERTREQLKQAADQISASDEKSARFEERALAAQAAAEQMRSSLPDTFKSLASEVLEKKSKTFAEQNQANLGSLLDPLKTRLKDFQEKLEAVHTEQVTGSATLREQVRILVESTSKVGEEANNLATALKGSNKAQGNWGELVLERILQSAGLREGCEYEAQESYAAENGKRAQPDVVIHLPGERHLVIDSKVSLAGYHAHCFADSDSARAAALNDYLNSVRTHVKGLSERSYQTLYGLNSLDFVIMFLPIEAAFMLALSGDDKLQEQAWQRNVLLVSPSTLLFAVRTVAYLWRQEQQKRNVEEIAKRGAELYNKLVGLVTDLKDVGGRLEQAQRSYESAFSKLSTGRSSVIWQAEKLRALGVKPARQLPPEMVEVARQEEFELEDPPVSE